MKQPLSNHVPFTGASGTLTLLAALLLTLSLSLLPVGEAKGQGTVGTVDFRINFQDLILHVWGPAAPTPQPCL